MILIKTDKKLAQLQIFFFFMISSTEVVPKLYHLCKRKISPFNKYRKNCTNL